jgi:alkanesulfonate monooxygenase SsuD/methylene tetrahydromethanopterin reductase-like flavin-dependent oxidoreductase (luciferase family)
MKIGFALPNIGPVATREAVIQVAQRAEALGYNSLWTIERLLWPVKPQTPYPVTPDGMLPEFYKYNLDPLDTLTFAAAHTKTIALGQSVLDLPYYNPVMLARRLTTIDFLSNGRLRVGLGLGWSKDEMDAAGSDMRHRGAMADEFLQVLKAIWTTNPVEFPGEVLQSAEVLYQSQAGTKAAPAHLYGSFCHPGLEACSDHDGRLESGGHSAGGDEANVRRHQANGEGSGSRPVETGHRGARQPGDQ